MGDGASPGLYKSLFVTYLILVLHGLLIVLFALLVVFLRGVVSYLPWIMVGGALLLGVSAGLLWRRLQQSRRGLRELLDSPLLKDRGVEIKLLGGVASLQLGAPVGASRAEAPALIAQQSETPLPQLEDAEALQLRRLAHLVKLKEQGALSEEEFAALRRDLST